jgi:hypothetical protein
MDKKLCYGKGIGTQEFVMNLSTQIAKAHNAECDIFRPPELLGAL